MRLQRRWAACSRHRSFCQRLEDARGLPSDVVEIVAVKALWNYSEPQLSIAWPQRVQSKTVNFTRFQHTSTSCKIWFGTRGSEVQILSPRPIKSITCSPEDQTLWY